MLALVLAAAFANPPAPAPTPPRVEQARDAVDWDAVEEEATERLSSYIQVDTTNPPGGEAAGVRWIADVLAGEGIAAQIVDHGGGRASLVARLKGDGTAPPLCLLSHVDVVTADAAHWKHPPLGGEVIDGSVWGRGALDMKGMGIVELETMILLARGHVPLARDVVLLAVADEEVGGLGMRSLVDDHWGEIGCSHLVNEGGIGLEGALFVGQTLHAISVAEKGIAWVKLTASGKPGHGSIPEPDREAPARLLAAMERIEKKYHAKPYIDPAMREMLRDAGRERGGPARAILGSRLLTGLLVRPRLLGSPETAAAITDTVHLTGMAGANEPNVVPSEVYALYDCRLLPGTTPDEMVGRLREIVRKVPGVDVVLLDGFESNRSPIDDPLYDRIAWYAVEGRPDSVAGPLLSVGFTDSLYARPKGVHAYGYVPFVVTSEEAGTMHGNDERVSSRNLRDGTRVLFSIVVDFAGKS